MKRIIIAWTGALLLGLASSARAGVEDKRDIQVRANDWFSIDFTRPPPSTGKPPAAPLPPPS